MLSETTSDRNNSGTRVHRWYNALLTCSEVSRTKGALDPRVGKFRRNRSISTRWWPCGLHGGSEVRIWVRTGPNFGQGMVVKSFLSAGVEIGPLIIDFEFPFSTRI